MTLSQALEAERKVGDNLTIHQEQIRGFHVEQIPEYLDDLYRSHHGYRND